MSTKPIVLISGFGPFGDVSINASWESIKLLPKKEIEQKYNVEILSVEIPVVYNHVDKLVPQLWNKYKPMLVIHVGVSHLANKLTLETKANAEGYCKFDCEGRVPVDERNCSSTITFQRINCGLNIEKICRDFNERYTDIKTCISNDAGRFLCEYIYFTSLSINPEKTLFVHVPDIGKPYSLPQTARGLGAIIELCIQQLQNCESGCNE